MGAYQYPRFYRNRMCGCSRCRFRSAQGAVWMVTIGVLFLLDTLGYVRFHYTWPVLLIVGGLVQVLSRSLSDEGHIQPGMYPAQPLGATPSAAPPPTSTAPQGGSNV